MATLLMPLPDSDFDPTESGVPWRTMRDHGHRVVFATPSGRTARADPKMVTGEGLGILSPLLKADANGRSAYLEMEQSDAGFRRPISYGEISGGRFRWVDPDGRTCARYAGLSRLRRAATKPRQERSLNAGTDGHLGNDSKLQIKPKRVRTSYKFGCPKMAA